MSTPVRPTDDTQQGLAGTGHDTFGTELIQARLEGLTGQVDRGYRGDRTAAVGDRQGPPLTNVPEIRTETRLELSGADGERLRHVVIVTTYHPARQSDYSTGLPRGSRRVR